jgi:hypothetical protein
MKYVVTINVAKEERGGECVTHIQKATGDYGFLTSLCKKLEAVQRLELIQV